MLLHYALKPVYWIRDGFVRSCKAVELGVDGLSPLLTHQPTSSMVGANPLQHVMIQDVHFYSSSGTLKPGIKGVEEILYSIAC